MDETGIQRRLDKLNDKLELVNNKTERSKTKSCDQERDFPQHKNQE